jgi:predicted lactoylglutathione lyase
MADKQHVFINLRVAELSRSIAFYEAIGFTKDKYFVDETAVCMNLNQNQHIHVMLITPERFRGFTPQGKEVSDAKTSAQVLLALSAESKAAVDEMVANAVKAGGKAFPPIVPETETMYGLIYEDPDGNIWEAVWVDMSAVEAEAKEEEGCPSGRPAE